jgi:hypothetical protein
VQWSTVPQSPSSAHEPPWLPLTHVPVGSVVPLLSEIRQNPDAQLVFNWQVSPSSPPTQL